MSNGSSHSTNIPTSERAVGERGTLVVTKMHFDEDNATEFFSGVGSAGRDEI